MTSRAALLHGVFRYLEAREITLTELLSFVLVHRQMNNPACPIYADLVRNTSTILSAFYYHPDTAAPTTIWAHRAMCTVYSGMVKELSDIDSGWHFSALQATPEKLADFRIEDMASKMHARAPLLVELVRTLLDATSSPHKVAEDVLVPDPEDSFYRGDGEKLPDSESTGGAGPASHSGQQDGGWVLSHEILIHIKTVTILSICLHSQDQHCNAFQSTVGIVLHACNAPEKVAKMLAHMGVSVSLSSIHRAIHSLAEEASYDVCQLGQTLLVSYGYDNLELYLTTDSPTLEKPGDGLIHLTSGALFRLDHGVTLDDLRCSRLLWDCSPLNPLASSPIPLDRYATMQFLYNLHREPDYSEDKLSRRGQFRSWHFVSTLFKHGPSALRRLASAIEDPEEIDPIPVSKLHYLPLHTMDLNEALVSGNIEAIQNMFSQAGVGDPSRSAGGSDSVVDLTEFVTIIHGDLGTYERVLSALHRRSVERSEYERLQSVVFAMGLFHFKMAAANAIWRIHVTPEKARVDDTSFMKIVGKLRPRDSSRLITSAKFRQQHELIHQVLTLLQLDAWRVEVKRRTKYESLEAWAALSPSPEEVKTIADTLARDYVEGEGLDLYELASRAQGTRDEVRLNMMRTMNHLLLYEELCYALNAGDIGRVETLLVPWVQIFRATGKHKYGKQTLRFMHALYFVYPERLRRAIRLNMLVNPTELINLFTKVTYGGEGSNNTKKRVILKSILIKIFRNAHANVEQNFVLPGLTNAHGVKDMSRTFALILDYMKTLHANEYQAGRTSCYPIRNVLVEGAATIEAESGLGKEDAGPEAPETAAGDFAPEESEDVEMELTAEDLSTN
ncbi:hypothetical protein C8Q80DRAFT_1123500 [Daedaleopsis nitida]|nr:hypothetical protein C8Q80DRAFT_1123500 [Daedaleopsis nitida]